MNILVILLPVIITGLLILKFFPTKSNTELSLSQPQLSFGNNINFSNVRETRKKEILKYLDQLSNFAIDKEITNINCPPENMVHFVCDQTFDSKIESKPYDCAIFSIANFICDLSTNSYNNAIFMLQHFDPSDALKRKYMTDLINNCYLSDQISDLNQCVYGSNRKICGNRVLACIFSKTFFARHRGKDEFKEVFYQALNECIYKGGMEREPTEYAIYCTSF